MGCLTGIITKSFLVAFNVVVAVMGVIVLTLASLVQTTLDGYGAVIPQDPLDVLIALQTISVVIICLGALGVVVSCCCGNKLFLYTYFVLGVILVIIVIVFGSMGAANVNNDKYINEIRKNMHNDIDTYDCSKQGTQDVDKIFRDNQCCGYHSATEMQICGSGKNQLPVSCCAANSNTFCEGNIYWTGCYDKLVLDVGDQATATFNLAIFFGVLLFALLTSTCLCVKCTDTMPI